MTKAKASPPRVHYVQWNPGRGGWDVLNKAGVVVAECAGLRAGAVSMARHLDKSIATGSAA